MACDHVCYSCKMRCILNRNPSFENFREQEDWLDVARRQRDLAAEGEWNNGDYQSLKYQVEREEQRRQEDDERGSW